MGARRNNPADGKPERPESKRRKVKRIKEWLAQWSRLEKDYAKIEKQLKRRKK